MVMQTTSSHYKLKDNISLWEVIQSLEACASDVKIWMLLVVVPKQHTTAIQVFWPTITLGSAIIEPAEAVCDLRVIFDQHMSMIPQFTTICHTAISAKSVKHEDI